MSKLAIIHHSACIAHDPGPNHSERSERLVAIEKALKEIANQNIQWIEAPRGNKEQILLAHTPEYMDFIFQNVPTQGYKAVEINEVVSNDDGGEVTTLSPASGEALWRSVGASCHAVDLIFKNQAKTAFAATRPPGHHALTHKSMGFCVFANAAIAARYAQQQYKIKKVAIVDFDVHHANGTQQIFEKDNSVLVASIHQLPLWPESGYEHETGVGNIINVPVKPDISRDAWMQSWQTKILPAIDKFAPEFIVISAGFDAHKDDPKGSQNLETQDYYTVTKDLISLAQKHAKGRIMSVLEGGYDIAASAASAKAHVQALLDS
ncbi:MAG: histone deacetylase family protein [Alphaproteobacteria bacterium]|nr:MAG: histone deacetylase family protein [Alphaproteobacteria bacterium]